VDGVNAGLPSFHRYLKLRQRILGLDQLHYYDLYAPLISDVPPTYTVEQAQTNVKAAMAPLGADYVAGLDTAFRNRWIDYYPMTGKQSGAYMSPGAYDVHPYLLLNYNGQYTDMSAMAHELGHAMHSYFSGKNQPYAPFASISERARQSIVAPVSFMGLSEQSCFNASRIARRDKSKTYPTAFE
jgi:oligoendopeptidase F